MYAFAANDIPASGVEASCSQCATPYRLTRVGDPAITAEILKPLEPTVLERTKSEVTVSAVLAIDNEPMLSNGLNGASNDGFAARVAELPPPPPVLEPAAVVPLTSAPGTPPPPPPAGPLTARPAESLNSLDAPRTVIPSRPPEPTAPLWSSEPSRVSVSAFVPVLAAPARVEPLGTLPASVDLDSEPSLGDVASAITDNGPVPTPHIKVPAATNERSRAGAASWAAPSIDPQAMMQSRVRLSDGRDRPKSRRPPFDDDDVATLRRDGKPFRITDASEFDDTDERNLRRAIRSSGKRTAVLSLLGIGVLVAIVFATVPMITGKSVMQILRGGIDDPHMRELLDGARVALLDDTDTSYRAAAKSSSEALDIDPANSEARTLYGLAAVFRGVDVRAAAEDMVRQGEVVQSSQMLATASAELAHARRVLSRKNDETAELAFASGIYYALDEDQRAHAREAYRRGMALLSLGENEQAPTAFAAYLDATVRNAEGDAEGARAALDRAIKLEPKWQRPRYDLARLEATRGEVNHARSLLQELLAAKADHVKALALLGVLPESVAVPTSGRAADVKPVQAPPTPPEPTQILPSATPESLQEDPRPQAPKPDAAKTQTPRPDPPAPNEVNRPDPLHPVTPRVDPPPAEPRGEEHPADPPSENDGDINTPPDAPSIVRGAPPPFVPTENPDPDHDNGAPPAPPGDADATN